MTTITPGSGFSNTIGVFEILLPSGTDVRDQYCSPSNAFDLVELLTTGAPLPFQVLLVADVGRGFTNEYRIAYVSKINGWPEPIPPGI